MERLGVVGISWRHGDAQALAAYTLPAAQRALHLADLQRQIRASEVVYLATCNRVEVALLGDGETDLAEYRCRVHQALTGRSSAGEAMRSLRVWAGEGAIEHLFLVAAGLDSAQLGEHEIPGQMRQAIDLARRAGSLGPGLDWLLGEALRVARSVRARSRIGDGKVSLAEIALDYVHQRLARRPGTVALIGISAMTERCGERLAGEGVPMILVNRRQIRAQPLASKIGARTRSLEAFHRWPDAVEVVMSATGAPRPLFRRGELERLAARSPSAGGPLLVDLAIPPDIDPGDARAVGLDRVGMDEITADAEKNSERRLEDAATARQLVDEALEELRREMTHRALSPILAGLQRRYRETALAGLDRLCSHGLEGLPENQLQTVRQWAQTLAKRLAHIPVLGLRGLAAEVGMPAVRTFLAATDDPLMNELADATRRSFEPAADADGTAAVGEPAVGEPAVGDTVAGDPVDAPVR
ncbi:MAG: hypothetical protein V3T72_21695 [Thermoanaerobaculia bacterium]